MVLSINRVVQVMKLDSSPRPSHQHHHGLRLAWCSLSVLTFKSDIMRHTPLKSSPFVSSDAPKKRNMSRYVLFGCHWLLPWNSAMDDTDCWVMTVDLKWGKGGSSDVVLGSFVICDLLGETSLCSWGHFCRPTIHYSSNSLHSWIMSLTLICPKVLKL